MKPSIAYAAIGLTVVALLAGCDRATPKPAEPAPPVPAKPSDYVGVYAASAGGAQVTIEVEAGTFEATAYTPAPPVRAGVRWSATGDSPAAMTWWTITGTVATEGRTVTLTVTSVVHGAHGLEGTELDRYRECRITATAGESLADELVAALLRCVGVTEQVTVHEQEPSASILGVWVLAFVITSSGEMLTEAPGAPPEGDPMRISADAVEVIQTFTICHGTEDAPPTCQHERSSQRLRAEIEETAITVWVPVPGGRGRQHFHSPVRIPYVISGDGQRMTWSVPVSRVVDDNLVMEVSTWTWAFDRGEADDFPEAPR